MLMAIVAMFAFTACGDDENPGVNQAMVGELNRKKSACNAANHHGCEHQ